MNRRQKINEEQVFKAIQNLKDSIFGLKQSYTRYCYRVTEEDGYVFDREKAKFFAGLLSKYSSYTRKYSEELAPVMPLYFEMCAMLLATICGKGDWVFVSFRKIAETAVKSSPEEESTLNRIVSRYWDELDSMFPDGAFRTLYEEFDSYMGRVSGEAFYYTVKYTLEDFLDDNSLNVLDRDRMTESAVARINRLAASIERDLCRTDEPGEDGE